MLLFDLQKHIEFGSGPEIYEREGLVWSEAAFMMLQGFDLDQATALFSDCTFNRTIVAGNTKSNE